MNFSFSEDQNLFNDSVCKYLNDHYNFESRRLLLASDAGFSHKVWSQCAEMGWLHLPFSEAQGGLSGTAVDSIILFESLGRHLVVEPFLETLITFGGVLRRVNSDAASGCIGPLMAGELQGAFAHFEAASRGRVEHIETLAHPCASGYRLTGKKAVVYNAPNADYLIVSARSAEDGEIMLFLVPSDTIGLTKVCYATVDGHQAAEVELQGAEVTTLLAKGDAAESILRLVVDEALVMMTAELVGAMDILVNITVDYAKQRKQFGVAIAKFQALQHQMSDMFMALELSRSLMYAAAIKLRDNDRNASKFVAAAKVKADKCAQQVAHSAIQIHGGIATTDELSVGHYLKRITILSNLFGSSRHHLQRFNVLSNAQPQ
ncbi:acyl-CoA dehydrogenase family protein [Halioxenophilus sp. WMMB6]|uniref:acyl-CoA dehydrogenase family protein n=1 Tax=Halioxenophilus sp. WMMB6 TaxID=3073815 RepID=UPI00295EBC47|nr:acyl-CoA dehydrogenase family protein [Halioxenophilus sp. WMMB6]